MTLESRISQIESIIESADETTSEYLFRILHYFYWVVAPGENEAKLVTTRTRIALLALGLPRSEMQLWAAIEIVRDTLLALSTGENFYSSSQLELLNAFLLDNHRMVQYREGSY